MLAAERLYLNNRVMKMRLTGINLASDYSLKTHDHRFTPPSREVLLSWHPRHIDSNDCEPLASNFYFLSVFVA